MGTKQHRNWYCSGYELENKVIEIFDAIGVEAKSANFEDYHRVGESKNNS